MVYTWKVICKEVGEEGKGFVKDSHAKIMNVGSAGTFQKAVKKD